MEILIPYGLPHRLQTFELMRHMPSSALATAISRANALPRTPEFGSEVRVLPHSAWLSYQFGLLENIGHENSPPIATLLLQSYGVIPSAGFWFVLNPVHLEVGMSQMILADQRVLELQVAESRTLFEAAQPIFEENGKELIYGDALTWFVRADDWQALQTSMPEVAIGRDIRDTIPQGDAELAWRTLQNEVQMVWHAHPVNIERSARNMPPVNSLWLWGGASSALPTLPAIVPYTATYKLSGWMRAFGQFSPEDIPVCTAKELLATPSEHGLVVLDDLLSPALMRDWSEWTDAYQHIDEAWLAPMIRALGEKKLDRLTLHLSHDTGLATFVVNRPSLLKFWVKKSLSRLLT